MTASVHLIKLKIEIVHFDPGNVVHLGPLLCHPLNGLCIKSAAIMLKADLLVTWWCVLFSPATWFLVGGFKLFEECLSNHIIFPGSGKNTTSLTTPPTWNAKCPICLGLFTPKTQQLLP